MAGRSTSNRVLARLPSVDALLAKAASVAGAERYARGALVAQLRQSVAALRDRILAGREVADAQLEPEQVLREAIGLLDEADGGPRPTRVINATGVVLHTNLGRALLASPAIEAVTAVASSATALEYDVASGSRGDRDSIVEEHLQVLTGAEAATVVNNNAAAVLLALNSLAEGSEVVVSRGELIEIGGSFRIPDVLAKSGARLREVGTTNRTHAKDYQDAVGPDTAVLMKVHTSNYRIVGFTAEVGLAELRKIADGHDGLAVVEDLGAGALVDLSRWGLPKEPVVSDRVAAGADLVTFSGDKLLGGPQCGIIVGRRNLVDRLRRNPLKRALRCDKMTLAALEATLRVYRFDPQPEATIPTLRTLVRDRDELAGFADVACKQLAGALGPDYAVTVQPSEAQIGSGAQPEVTVPSLALGLRCKDRSADSIAGVFRGSDPPIIGRIERDLFLLDLRAVEDAGELIPRPAKPA
ncbi:MAG: L-seryl-tRNA(Sec) selenium transferase [Deltaproteobacteria bacterium]